MSNEELNRFFDFVWGSQEGVVYLPTKAPDGRWTKVFYEWPNHRAWIVKHVMANTATGKDVYYSPAIFSKDAILHKSADKEYVLGTNVIWVEFDGNAPESWDGTPEPSEAGSDEPPAAPGHSVGQPSLRIQSSLEGREHVYWRLEEFTTDISAVERINRALAYQFHADTSGWDINQVLRPVGTTNYKRNLPVVTIEESDRTYRPGDFTGFDTAIKDLVAGSIDEKAIVDINQIMGKHRWDIDSIELINKSQAELGGRDRSSALMRMGFRGAELGLNDQELFSLLIYLDDKWEKFKFRDDRNRRLIEIVNKARLKHPAAVAELIPESAPAEQAPKIIMGFETFLLTSYKIDWVIENLISTDSINLIYSEPGVGKTQFMMNLGMHLALAKPFLGLQPLQRQKTILFSLEMGAPKLKYLSSIMAGAYEPEEIQTLEKNFLVAPIGNAINLASVDGRGFLESILEEYRPHHLCIDSLQRVLVKDLSDDEQVRQFFAYIHSLITRFGVYFSVVHHGRKRQGDNKKPVALADVYGSQYIGAEADLAISLWEDREKKEIEVFNPKNRLGEPLDPFRIKRVEHLQMVKVQTTTEEASDLDKLRSGAPMGDGPAFKFGM